ncbi:unnamed protein product, partial [Coregonus sp. 'balchen']
GKNLKSQNIVLIHSVLKVGWHVESRLTPGHDPPRPLPWVYFAMPPEIVVRPRDQITAQGRTVTFLCGTKGNPPPAVFWQKEGSQILLFPIQEAAQSGRFSVSLSGELTITDVHSEDSGYYICQAISVAGSILTKALLEVESAPSDRIPPIIRQGPANQTLAPGSTTQFQCQVMGNPLPSIQWEKDGQRILGDERVSLMEKGTFQITNLQVPEKNVQRTFPMILKNVKIMFSMILINVERTLQKSIFPSSVNAFTPFIIAYEIKHFTLHLNALQVSSYQSSEVTLLKSGGSSVPQASEPFQLPGPPQKPVVTDVTRNSVTLTWQPNAHEGGAAVTSYIIEAFSQSAGSTWQTVADLVKLEKHTVSGLFPNTIYLFIVRAVNAYGLSDPSPISEPVRTQDVSPTGQGVDHRQVQKELGEVAVQLQEPVTLTASSVQVSWTVDRQSQYIQGYRILYRPSGGTWQLQDVKAPSERLAVVADLLKGTEYEIKIRPYFDEFQGMDSRLLLVRTPEEVPSAPPKAVTVVTVKLSNSSSISVSWEPPPAEMQNGIIQEYKVWCVGNDTQTRYHINTTVDGTFLSTVLKGLLPGILYQVEVAAVTSAGVGTHSQPVSILIKLPAEAPSVSSTSEGEDGDEGSLSLAEQITDVVKQPAFIAGIGGACWVILMSFSMWIYCRRKKRKELNHYTASFNYTPAVGFPHGEASGLNGRPGMLGGNMGNYPWLADSWPTTDLVHSGKEAVNCCTSKHDTAERYYNEAGISIYLNQTEKYSTGDSTEGPIYSTIDPTAEDLRSFNSPYSSTTPYASTPIMPFTNQALQGSHSPTEQDGGHWITQPAGPSSQYAQPDRCRTDSGKPKQKSDEEEWCPPLPERTYLTEGCEDGPAPPLRGGASSPTTSYSHQSTATLTPSPREESHHPPHDTACLHHNDGQHLARRLPCGPVPVPRAPSPPLTQSNPNLSAQQHGEGSEGGTPIRNGSAHRRDLSQGATLSADNVSSTTPDLPPPPEPPPENGAVWGPAAAVDCDNTSLDREGGPGLLSSIERREGERCTPNRKGSGRRRQDDEDLIPYGKPSYLVGRGGHMSSNCSTTGSSSSRGSTGSRGGHCLGRKRNEEMR